MGTWLETKVWSLEVTWIAFDSSFLSGTKGTWARPALHASTPGMTSNTRNFAPPPQACRSLVAAGRSSGPRRAMASTRAPGTAQSSSTSPTPASSLVQASISNRACLLCVCVVRAIRCRAYSYIPTLTPQPGRT